MTIEQAGADDIDSILQSIESKSTEIPMTKQEVQPPTPDVQKPTEYEYEWNGKKIKEPVDMILKRASMGYDYAQKMADFKAKAADLEARTKGASELEMRWKPYDEFAQKHPEWMEHVQKSWEQREAITQGNFSDDPVHAELRSLKAQIQELIPFKEQVLGEFSKQKQAQADKQLQEQAEILQKKYPEINWQETDETGANLDYKVTKYAAENGLTLNAAFHDLMADRLQSIAAEKAKETVMRQLQAQKKQGIVGQTSQPTIGIKRAENISTKSYDDLMREALAEMGS